MEQDEILYRIVAECRQEPHNKITISGDELASFAIFELGRHLEEIDISVAVNAFREGSADWEARDIVDAATALCHQAADRVWGKCLDEQEDEWEEVDISTEWDVVPQTRAFGVSVTIIPA